MKRRAPLLLLLLAACSRTPPASAPAVASPTAAVLRTPDEKRATFQKAVALFDGGDAEAAEPFFLTLAAQYPELADHSLYYLARIAERRGDAARARTHWQSLALEHSDSIWFGAAALALGRASFDAGEMDLAERWLAEARTRLGEPRAHAEALWLSSQAARRRGDLPRARELARELRRRHPATAEAAAARDEAWAEREGVSLADTAALLAELGLLLEEGQPARALELAQAGRARFAADRDFAEILRSEALARLRSGERDAGIAALERVIARYPKHPAAARGLYRLAELAWNADDDARALRLFERFARVYPKADQAAEALYAAGRIHQEAGRWSAAGAAFSRLARRHPKSSLAGEAGWRVAWCAYRGGARSRAVTLFTALAAKRSPERASALYWRERVRQHGDGAGYGALLQEFPESYYARLSEERLGRPEGAALLERGAPGTAGEPAPCSTPDPHRGRFEELRAMGLARSARLELAAFEPSASGCEAFLMHSWLDVAGYRQATTRALRAGGCDWQSPWLGICYPLAYWDRIREHAARRGLDPYLVIALVRQESLFDPEARSTADARGLMQILPATGDRVAQGIGRSDFSPERLFAPEDNLELGTAYLSSLLQRYGGNLPRAIAAYNGGEAAVDKWQRRYTGLADDEFVESISFRETRQYVKRVLANERIYRTLYAARR